MLTENILSLYRSASLDSVDAGMSWYPEAKEYAQSLDLKWHRAAGVIAALSPLSNWNNNKRKAARLYAQNGEVVWDGNKNGIGLPNNVKKAIRIYNGEDALDLLVRPKTRNFFLSIIEPERTDLTAVVDRHAFDIALGRVTSNSERYVLGRKGVYDEYALAYAKAAHSVSIPVQCLQAITWVEWRKRIGKGWGG